MTLLDALTTLVDAAYQVPQTASVTAAIKRTEERIDLLRRRRQKLIHRRAGRVERIRHRLGLSHSENLSVNPVAPMPGNQGASGKVS